MSMLRTSAKCVIHTSKGDLEVELWAKECSKTCRAFLQGAVDGMFTGGKLNDYVKGQYLQFVRSDDKSDNVLCSTPEPNSRLGVSQDGVLCWNIRSDTWLISTAPWTSYNSKEYTVFGVVVGESIYKLREILRGDLKSEEPQGNSQFLYPAVVNGIDITVPYFDNLHKRKVHSTEGTTVEPPTKKKQVARNIKLNFDSADSDDESEDDLQVAPRALTKLKMRPSPMLKFKKKREDKEKEVHAGEKTVTAPSKSSEDKPLDATSGTNPIDDPPLSDREKRTLELMAKFKSATKNKNILSKFNE